MEKEALKMKQLIYQLTLTPTLTLKCICYRGVVREELLVHLLQKPQVVNSFIPYLVLSSFPLT